MKIRLLLLTAILLSGCATQVRAQQLELVKDINPAVLDYVPLSDVFIPHATLNGMLFYISHDQVWRTDGTQAGTIQLTDLFSYEDQYIEKLTAAGRYIYFKKYYKKQGWLFRTDGTVAGTIPLHRLSWIAFLSNNDILEINGTVYFAGNQDNQSIDLWKTDGSIAGTRLVKKLQLHERNISGPSWFKNFNGVLHFLITSGYGQDATAVLWRSDGTEAGTQSGPGVIPPFYVAVAGSYMFFAENNSLKKTDGKTVTTVAQGFTSIDTPVAVGRTVFFSAGTAVTGQELWKSDGTTSGTVLVKDIFPGGDEASSYPGSLTSFNNTLYFSASSGEADIELWKSDGTTAGTLAVTDINKSTGQNYLYPILVVNGQLAFIAGEGNKAKLWKSDGTSAGTSVVAGFPSSRPIVKVGNKVFFQGREQNRTRLYESDLTVAGTRPLPLTVPAGSFPGSFTRVKDAVYFTADDGVTGQELWKSDGTTAGTSRATDITAANQFNSFNQQTTINNTLYFVTESRILWKTGGTTAGTVQVRAFTASSQAKIKDLTPVGNTLYFAVTTPRDQTELWKSDGTTAGTVQVMTLGTRQYFNPAAFKGSLYFCVYTDLNDKLELWKSDGTAAGTVPIEDPALPETHEGPNSNLIVSGEYMYFFAYNKLMKTDGTAEGTVVVKKFYDEVYIDHSNLYLAAGLMYFSFVRENTDTVNFWRSDGTADGTFELATFDENQEYSSHYIRHFTEAGGKLFFVPYDSQVGDQLWVSDGTVAGTRRVKQTDQFPDTYEIGYSATLDDIFYYTMHEESTGTELWRSDGTQEGTYLVQDFTPGGSTNFGGIVRVNGMLLLSVNGELYKYKPATATQAIRINSGGGTFNASSGRMFSADDYFSGTTSISSAASGDILNTADDQLYREQRFGSSFSYAIPVKNGKADVLLHFAETYWGVPARSGTTGTNRRKFHVDMEGSRKLTNYDIFAAAGGAMRAKTEHFTVNVTDGMLNIEFLSGTADKPAIAAVEVIPDAQFVLEPVADAYVRNTPNQETNYGKEATLEVKAGSLPSYQRNTYLKFPLFGVGQISSARLRVFGSNVQSSAATTLSVFGVQDDNWLEEGIAWQNAPSETDGTLGSIEVTNTKKYYELDVTAYVRSQLSGNRSVSLLLTNPNNQNARLTFNSRESAANRPQLVIETTAPPAARTGSEQEFVIVDQEISAIYPNPAGKYFTVQLSKAHQGKTDIKLSDLSGNTVWAPGYQSVRPASQVEVDLSAQRLPAGIYMIKIRSAAFTETLRVLLTGQ
ncbi:ELWxxDGT repeat protein [Dyadobacter sp. NIV53]|uniref:ELWxxDGT repeat protein n=1 Tax=Dyadobacter sp. NIV53 TaxID=2861765 RepID=UPI001C86E1EC|nr:ELWxxDGT repeat protein [Dyadobacter sp. NIV53]